MPTITRAILGAPDPEMAAIEAILRAAGVEVIYARTPDGERVTPATAYQQLQMPPDGGTLLLVECGAAPCAACGDAGTCDTCTEGGYYPPVHILRADHHRPGDPGYGRGPEEYWEGSSLGQVCTLLGLAVVLSHRQEDQAQILFDEPDAYAAGWRGVGGSVGVGLNQHWPYGKRGQWEGTPPPVWACGGALDHVDAAEALLIAAADHCLAAAYRGECPGVMPEALLAWRVASRAAFQRRPIEALQADVDRAHAALLASPRCDIGGVAVVDLGEVHVPEAPEAACRWSIPFLATVTERGGARKRVLQAAPPEVVAAWMAANPGSYGDPARGYAGIRL